MSITLTAKRVTTVCGLVAVALAAGFGGAAAEAAEPQPAQLSVKRVASTVAPQSRFAAGFGYVAWVEATKSGRRHRVALRAGRKERRSPWFKATSLEVALERKVDLRTNRPVVRVAVSGRRDWSSNPRRIALLSPKTLRSTATRWPSATSGAVTAVDGMRVATITTAPLTSDAPADSLPACHTQVASPTPSVAIPPVPDCIAQNAILRDSRLLLHAEVPSLRRDSEAKSSSATSAWHFLDLTRPEAGWTLLGPSTVGFGGDDGLLEVCVLDRGLALLSGHHVHDVYGIGVSSDKSRWNVDFVPTDGKAKAWSAPAGRIASFGPRHTQLGCSRNSIYALYPTHSAGSDDAKPSLVQLTVRGTKP